MNPPRIIAFCALSVLAALYVVGVVNHEILRHFVQTLPLWFAIFAGFRQQELAKWSSLPSFIIWLVLMVFIWLFVLGWAKLISGHFTPLEIVLTVVVGAASLMGLTVGYRWQTRLSWGKALWVFAIFIVLQLLALRISFLPSIARDRY